MAASADFLASAIRLGLVLCIIVVGLFSSLCLTCGLLLSHLGSDGFLGASHFRARHSVPGFLLIQYPLADIRGSFLIKNRLSVLLGGIGARSYLASQLLLVSLTGLITLVSTSHVD